MPTYKLKAKRKIDESQIARISFCAICASLFTYGFCFPIIDEHIAGVLMAFFVIVEIIRQKYMPIDLAFLILMETMLCVALIDFYTTEDYRYKIHWAIVLPLGYLLGKAIVGHGRDTDKRTLIAYASLAVGMFAQGVVDYTYGHIQIARGERPRWEWLQFWTRDFEVKNTYEIEFMLTISAVGLALYIFKKNRTVSLLILLANVYIQICAAISSGRGPVMYALAALLLFFIMYFYDRGFKLKKREKKIFIVLATLAIIFIILAVIFVEFNFFGLIEVDEDNYWFRDGGIFHNVRFAMDIAAIKLLFSNPLGGSFTITEVSSYYQKSHCLWTEYGREWGFLPFVMLCLFSIFTVVDAVRLALSKEITRTIKYILVTSFACMMLYNLMEPVGHSRRHFLLFLLFISGMIRRQLEIKSKA